MEDKKVIAVAGATGAQGGGLVHAILDDKGGGFKARALTRNVNSEKAKALAQAGVEVIAANLDDLDSVKKAFEGVYGAYCVTFYWEHLSPEKELAHARTMAEAAKHAGVQHVIWSTLEDTRKWVPLSDKRMPTLMGKYKVPHFDAKGEANHFFSDLNLPVTFLLTSFYWDNFVHFGMGPKEAPQDNFSITLPMGDKRLPGMAAEDIGKCAYGIFRKGREYVGKTVGIAGEILTMSQIAEKMSRALGREVRYQKISPVSYRKLGFPGADDLGNMFQFKQEFEKDYCGARDPGLARELNPSLMTFDDWVAKYAGSIPMK